MIILAIETSCDDTCVSVIEAAGKKHPHFNILSNIVSSQVKLHARYGGVYPSLAKREHQRNLLPVLIQSLKQGKLLQISKSEFLISKPRSRAFGSLRGRQILNSKSQIINKILEREPELLKRTLSFLKKHQKPDIDLIAVTVGPGLEPCLWVGVNFAKALAYVWDVPVVPVNHIEAHILAVCLLGAAKQSGTELRDIAELRSATPAGPVEKRSFLYGAGSRLYSEQITFPAICLVVSGGHTQLILMKGFGQYKIIGETRDDAAGECFDKTARILGLGYPGGPAIAKLASQWKSQIPSTKSQINSKFQIPNSKFNINLPRPMLHHKNYDFSFSGLKTAVLYDFKKQSLKIRKSLKYIQAMCREIQQAIIDVLIAKTIKAAKDFKAKSIILGGGVSANKELRQQIEQTLKKELPNSLFMIPDSSLCTDNAAMVGVTGYYQWLAGKKKNWRNIEARANLRIGN